MYANGQGLNKDDVEAVNWYRKAAEQGFADAQYNLGVMYSKGDGVPKDYVESYKWRVLAASQGDETAKKSVSAYETIMTREQIAEGQKLAREFKPRDKSEARDVTRENLQESRPDATGSGFFITNDGYLITNQHVAGRGATVRVLTASGIIPAKVIKVDELNDMALLKAEGKYASLPVVFSRKVQLGATVATVGFPNIGLQGFSPKLAKGEIASLAGIQDDARHFQISVPVQPGNSGGALVDERGNVIGVVVAKLSQKAALATSGSLAENVNYAIKSSYLLSFLESVPEVAAKLKEPNTTQRDFETTIKDVEQAAVLVLVY
jgi:S1-C subfamily serine protease